MVLSTVCVSCFVNQKQYIYIYIYIYIYAKHKPYRFLKYINILSTDCLIEIRRNRHTIDTHVRTI